MACAVFVGDEGEEGAVSNSYRLYDGVVNFIDLTNRIQHTAIQLSIYEVLYAMSKKNLKSSMTVSKLLVSLLRFSMISCLCHRLLPSEIGAIGQHSVEKH